MDELKLLCEMDGISGDEAKVREYIINRIKDKAEITVDPLGNIIAFVKGKKPAKRKVMIDAHTDEVGMLVTSITEKGMLKFDTVGGIEVPSLLGQRVSVNGLRGVISIKPIHMVSGDEKNKLPKKDALYIDIGAESKEQAEEKVKIGDSIVFDSGFEPLGDLAVSKAFDDRGGCLALLEIINSEVEYDFYATFTVQEELGVRGAKVAAYSVEPDYAIAVENTTAADIADVPDDKRVCEVLRGAAVSFMDRATLYDKRLFQATIDTAKEQGIPCQVKTVVSGGNNAGAIHVSRGGVKTIAISVPCRYIHSPSSVASMSDIKAVTDLTRAMLNKMASGALDD